ncbi:MAG TPA: DUF4230 domain-containing protein [Spirochaetia bacterium]|nr:DUF4230 domain-containing protein [Spirochaetia bacterium]
MAQKGESSPQRLARMRRPAPLWIYLPLAALLSCCTNPPVDTKRIETGIRQLLELRTSEQVYRAIGYISQEKSVLIFKTVDRQLLYSVDIRIDAGVDLSDGLQVATIPGDSEGLQISLPPAKVLSADADESSIRQYFSHEKGGAVSLLDYGDQIAELKSRTVEDAIKRGILVQADQNARKVVSNFLRSLGITDVRFTPGTANDR